MLEFLIAWDKALFFFINMSLANPVTDLLMPLVTSDNLLRILYAITVLLLLWKGNARLRWLVLFSALALLLSDQLSSALLKPMIDRLRPCHQFAHETINLLVGCGGGKAMPSSHATNAFAQAALFGWLFPRIRWYLFGCAFVIAISRVFVGVHFPGDVLAGALLGSAIGVGVALMFTRIEQRLPGVAGLRSQEKTG